MKVRAAKKAALKAKAGAFSGVLLPTRCEISRSFSYKLNVGNFESRDFFCAQKTECSMADAEAMSERVYQFCKTQVLKAVREYQEERNGNHSAR